MYTSIPVYEAINLTVSRLEESNFNYHGINSSDIKTLLRKILSNMCFNFKGRIFKQTHGLAMGSRLSGLLATVFMDSLERQVITTHQIPFYRRYVDDTFILAKDQQHAHEIFEAFSSAHPALKFEMEQAQNGTLNLLDISVSISGGHVKIGFYQKAARSDIFVHKASALPMNTKKSIILNERKRIQDRSRNDNDDVKRDLMDKLDAKLRRNGYKQREITETTTRRYRKHENQSQQACQTRKPFFFSAPFVNDAIDHKLKRLFKKMKIPVLIAHKGRTLRQALQKKQNTYENCNIPNCITPRHLCHLTKVVYMFVCSICRSSYIGSTRRKLHTRVREHLTMKSSAIHQHKTSFPQATWGITVINHAKDPVDLRIREALQIATKKPTLNNKEEIRNFRLL